MAQARNTKQKEAIREAFLAAGRPLSRDEALAAAQQRVDGLSVATVYRNISLLLEEQWLTRVEVPGDTPRYEVSGAVSGKAHHHHFRCNRCGRLFELDGCSIELRTYLPDGFQLTGHEFYLFGLCEGCTRAADLRAVRAGGSKPA